MVNKVLACACLKQCVCVCVTERQRDRATERQRDRETERQRDRNEVVFVMRVRERSSGCEKSKLRNRKTEETNIEKRWHENGRERGGGHVTSDGMAVRHGSPPGGYDG